MMETKDLDKVGKSCRFKSELGMWYKGICVGEKTKGFFFQKRYYLVECKIKWTNKGYASTHSELIYEKDIIWS